MAPPPSPSLSTRRGTKRLVLAFAALLMLVSQLVTAPAASAAPAAPIEPSGDRPVLYLTFDDGPGGDTPAFLDLLARHDVTATFFVTGAAVTTNPDTARRIAADGHVIANHTWSHPALSSRSNEVIRSEFTRTTAVIESTVGLTPVCYRPPYGATNARVHEQAVAVGLPNADWTTGRGSHLGLWDVDTNDWRLSLRSSSWSEGAMMARLNSAGDGDTVLLHDGFSNRRRGLAVLTRWLDANRDRFEFRGLPGCEPLPVAPPAPPAPPEEPTFDPDAPEQWHRARIARLYQAYFGRLPDAEGWEYWNREYTEGSPLAQISYSFAVSSEFTATEVLSDEAFVEFVYRKVLDREPDAEGFAYWLDQLAGDTDRGELVLYFSDGREFITRTAPAVTGECFYAASGDPVVVAASYRCWAEGLPTYDW